MKKEVYNFRTYYYLPWRGLLAPVLVLIGIIIILSGKMVLGSIAVLLAGMVFTTHYGVQINIYLKTYLDYHSILGFKSGEELPYEKIDYVFIKTSKQSQRANSLATSRTFHDDVFDGYIKFDGREKIFLLSHRKREKVMKKLNELSGALGVPVMDYTKTSVE